MENRIPTAPLVLGLAGLVPPIAGAAAVCLNLGHFGLIAREATLLYAGLIFSFLGGTWWSFASWVQRPSWGLLIASVVPSLAAWGILLGLNGLDAGVAMAALILLSLLVDWRLQQVGLAPPWWMKLRVPLTLTLAVALLVVTFGGRS